MTVARVLFLARYRVPHACFALQWDHMLQGIDHTIVATPMTRDELEPVWERYGIDSSGFEYVNDADVYQRYPQVNNWVFEDDYRGWWLRQQAIKLSYLDMLEADVMLMHDPDTFMIEPYQCYNPNTDQLNMMTLLNTTQGSYEGVFQSIMGIERTTPHCFVTELVPVRKSDFVALRKHLAARWPTKHWLDAIIEAVPGMPTVPPWGTGNIIKWFSEYEFLGNWAVHCGNVAFQEQRRFDYDHLDKINQFDIGHNAVCDAVPDLRWSMQMDWDTLNIPGFDQYRAQVSARIYELENIQSRHHSN
jgi:hypothetical protein